jgi:dTDP-4-amino-4,6-dideoxygalactose transaminase
MNRDEVGQALLEENIPTKKYFYPPLHRQRLFKANECHVTVIREPISAIAAEPDAKSEKGRIPNRS